MHYLLLYDVVDDFLAKRLAHRAEHLALARQAYERGELALAGALAEPADGAVLVFRGAFPGAAEAFAAADPYVRSGLVKSWRVRKWSTVLGDGATFP
ncbi:MAG TPA: YciI-like protein [Candidatus Acidoferrales bacterium]|nr:YciI-like protein [Candidatus Acidoferrales bacterium]